MLRLFLENTEVELYEDFSCPITRTFEDLSNPTSIINDYSKTITIPHTQKNDQLFGFIYHPDRLVAANTNNQALKGIYFDPYKKINFRLEWNDAVVMVGYLKVLSVSSSGYECTLNGELGKVFQEMQKMTFDETEYTGEDKDKYWIDSSQYVNTKINKELVYDSWNSDGQTDLVLRKVDDPDYKVTDIIGFTPNNAFNSDFDYTSYENKTNTIEKLSAALDESAKNKRKTTFSDLTNVDSSTAVGDGISPRGMGEFRSYLQLPFIYFNKLFNIFCTKAETTTGYTIDLDTKWFNTRNPYWKDLVISLKNLQVEIDSDLSTGEFYGNVLRSFALKDTYYKPNFTKDTTDLVLANYVTGNNIFTPDSPFFTIDKPTRFYGTLPVSFKLNGITKETIFAKILTDNCVNVIFTVYNDQNEKIDTVYLAGILPYDGDEQSLSWSAYKSLVKFPKVQPTAPETTILVPFDFTLFPEYEGNIKIVIETQIVGNTNKIFSPEVESFSYAIGASTSVATNYSIQFGYTNRWAYINCNLSDFWNENTSVFDLILNYCKIFRLLFKVDDINKTLKIVQATDYFADYKVLDYTQKLNKSKDYIVTPVTFDKKYILFNYTSSDSDLAQKYKEAYNYNYGEKRLETKYNFNTDTNELFSNVTNAITYSPYVYNWNDLYNNLRLIYKLPAEIYLDCGSDATTYSFGAMFFVNKKPFDMSSNLREPIISDDTELQISTDTYCYSQTNESINCYWYLEPSLKYNNNLCLFSKPQENHTYDNDYLDNTTGIYNNYWSSYIDERYNQQNKLVTCYLNLTPSDFINFEFNKFLLIENQLYIVNKIYDYDINSNEPTKVDLITIQSIDGYTKNTLS